MLSYLFVLPSAGGPNPITRRVVLTALTARSGVRRKGVVATRRTSQQRASGHSRSLYEALTVRVAPDPRGG
jgi:hypothetical protein